MTLPCSFTRAACRSRLRQLAASESLYFTNLLLLIHMKLISRPSPVESCLEQPVLARGEVSFTIAKTSYGIIAMIMKLEWQLRNCCQDPCAHVEGASSLQAIWLMLFDERHV